MKAVHQLISYFYERGRLRADQLNYLVSKGYWSQYTAADLPSLVNQIGQSFFFQVTGELGGALWGTDIYTSDSNLGKACVHAGILQPGETGVVKVTMEQPVPVFRGSVRNKVVSSDWTTGWNGAYRVEAVHLEPKRKFGRKK